MDLDDAGAPLPARVRRDRTLELLRERDFVRVGELAGRFGVSEVTVRADLDALADRGLLHRVRGGAVPRTTAAPERTFEESEVAAAAEKRAIARAAVDLVEPGDSLILDVGTTTTAIAHELADHDELTDITVFTSSLTIALALEAATPRITVVVTGGTLRAAQHSLVEPLAGLVLDAVHVRTAFLGCSGVDVDDGVTNVNLPEAAVKQRMLRAAERRVVCADASKLGRVALAHVCTLDEVDVLLTDTGADADLVERLHDTGVDLRLAGRGP